MKECNRCNKELELYTKDYYTELDDIIRVECFVCASPSCLNYSLVQIPSDEMTANDGFSYGTKVLYKDSYGDTREMSVVNLRSKTQVVCKWGEKHGTFFKKNLTII